MKERNEFGPTRFGVYGERTRELLTALIRMERLSHWKADPVDHEDHGWGYREFPVAGQKLLLDTHTFKVTAPGIEPITTYGDHAVPFGSNDPRTMLTLCFETAQDFAYGTFIDDYIGRSENGGELLLYRRLRAKYCDNDEAPSNDDIKVLKDAMGLYRMLCIILCGMIPQGTEEFDIEVSTDTKVLELTEHLDALSKDRKLYHESQDVTMDDFTKAVKTSVVKTEKQTIHTSKSELLAFGDFLQLIPNFQKSKVNAFIAKHGEDFYKSFRGEVEEDPFKLASFKMIADAHYADCRAMIS